MHGRSQLTQEQPVHLALAYAQLFREFRRAQQIFPGSIQDLHGFFHARIERHQAWPDFQMPHGAGILDEPRGEIGLQFQMRLDDAA